MADRGTAVLPIVIVQQARTRLRAQIGQQTFPAVGPNLDAGGVRFQEDGFTDEHGPQPGPGVALEDKDPGFVLCMELPVRLRREVDPLKDEMWAGDEQGSGIGKAPRNGLAFSRPRIRGRHGVVYVKFPLPTMVEKAERRVASLLDLCNHESRADGMDRAGWDENDVVLQDAVPLNQVRNRAVLDRGPQLRGRELPLQPDGNFGAGRCGKDVPGLGLAMPQTDRLREGIVRVNLDRQRFLGEQQLEEQGRVWRVHVWALKPEFADRDAILANLAPGPEIGASPGFAHDPHAGMFDRHDILLVRTAQIGSPRRRTRPFSDHAPIVTRGGQWRQFRGVVGNSPVTSTWATSLSMRRTRGKQNQKAPARRLSRRSSSSPISPSMSSQAVGYQRLLHPPRHPPPPRTSLMISNNISAPMVALIIAAIMPEPRWMPS